MSILISVQGKRVDRLHALHTSAGLKINTCPHALGTHTFSRASKNCPSWQASNKSSQLFSAYKLLEQFAHRSSAIFILYQMSFWNINTICLSRRILPNVGKLPCCHGQYMGNLKPVCSWPLGKLANKLV